MHERDDRDATSSLLPTEGTSGISSPRQRRGGEWRRVMANVSKRERTETKSLARKRGPVGSGMRRYYGQGGQEEEQEGGLSRSLFLSFSLGELGLRRLRASARSARSVLTAK